MVRKFDKNYEKLMARFEKNNKEFSEKFAQEAVFGVEYSKFISIVEDVKDYWKDLRRRALISLSCEAVGGQQSMVDNAILMLSLLTAGMGIHDDIIDKSSVKHFSMTIPGIHGHDYALLVGDLLIIKGLIYSQKSLGKFCSQKMKEAILEALQNFCFEIFEGELMDISSRQNLDTDLKYCFRIMWKLTADAEACSRIGAILGGGSEKEIDALSEFGRRVGLMVLLGEELSDSLNREGALPHRLKHESVPLPILYAAKSSKEIYTEIKSNLQKPLTPAIVSALIELCWKTKAITYIYNLAKKNATHAVRLLQSLKHTEAIYPLKLMLNAPLRYIKQESSLEKEYHNLYS